MALVPDLRTLHAAATAVDRTADVVEADAVAVKRLVEDIPWRGPRRDRALSLVTGSVVAVGRSQVGAERALARALRDLARAVERELEDLAVLAARARRHLDDLATRARGLVALAVRHAADAMAGMAKLAVEVVTGDIGGAVRAAHAMVERAESALRTIIARISTLPEPFDPAWRRLGPQILQWQPL